MKKTLCLVVICLSLITASSGQVNYFKDTTVRVGSTLTGSFRDTDGHVYFWGHGTGVAFNMAALYKIDSTGKEVWNTLRDSAFAMQGFFTSAFVDKRFVYAFGWLRYDEPGPFCMAKFDKETGALIYLKDSIPVNAFGIIQIKDSGDALRIVYKTYNRIMSEKNWPPAKVTVLNKDNGQFSTEQIFGLNDLVPMYIDNDDNLYYNITNDTLVKYNLPSARVVWKNKTNFETYYYSPPTPDLVVKNEQTIYSMGSNFARAINDSTGETIWNHFIGNSSFTDFHPFSIQFVKDTLYSTWGHIYASGNNQYNAILTSFNKKTGQEYIYGNISDEEGVAKDAISYFTKTEMAVDSHGKIYLFGYDIPTNERKMKKLNGDGSLVYKMSLPRDYVVERNNKSIPWIPLHDYRKVYLFNDKPYFLFHNQVETQNQYYNSNHIAWLELDPNAPVVKAKQNYDKDYYQYPSTVVDIQKFRGSTYVLKMQGREIFLERYTSNRTLAWQKVISDETSSIAQGFAIDSSGRIAVFCYNLPRRDFEAVNTLNSYFPNDRILLCDADGNLLKDYREPKFFAIHEKYEVLGTENGFYVFNSTHYYQVTTEGYAKFRYGTTNLHDAIFHNSSHRVSHLVNTKDSIYVFSGRLENTTHPFFVAINKTDRLTAVIPLSASLPNGFLVSAKKSAANPSQVYICGLDGKDLIATLIKYDLSTRSVLWKYTYNKLGEAFKVVEDSHGNVYALIQTDSIMLSSFNSNSGKLNWANKQKAPGNSKCIDLAVDPAGNRVMAGILHPDANRPGKYYSSLLEFNGVTGELLNSSDIKGGIGDNYIHAIESTPVGDFMVGGNRNDATLGGLKGFLSINRNSIPCNVSAAFKIVQDAADSSSYTFVNQSTTTAASTYTWSFGDGDSSFQNAPTHRYADAGSYTVQLDLNDANGCSASETKTITVAPVTCNLTASIGYGLDPYQPTQISFFGFTEDDATKYHWNFGDGQTDSIANPFHVFKSPGQYQVCFTALKNNYCSKEVCETLTITASRPRLQVTPNPVVGTMEIYLEAETAGNFEVQIIDLNGNILFRQTFTAQQGPNQFPISVTALKAGLYIITARNSSQQEQTRFLKL